MCSVQAMAPECVLCPRTGGAFKATCKDKWVHLFCALMMPGVHFKDPDQMTGINVRGVHKDVSQPWHGVACMVWGGVAWRGVVSRGVVWCGVAWRVRG